MCLLSVISHLVKIFPGGGSVCSFVNEVPVPEPGVRRDCHHVARHEVEAHSEEDHQGGHQAQHHRVFLELESITGAPRSPPSLRGGRLLHMDTHVGLGVLVTSSPDHLHGLVSDYD